MKAVVIRNKGRGVEAWTLVDKPDPTPGPGQVLVRVRAVSLNYRDCMIARGEYGGPLGEDVTALADGAGEIAAVGAGVTESKVGDRVTSTYFPTWQHGPMHGRYFAGQLGALANDGVLAEWAVLPANGVVRIPARYSFEAAATLPCAAVTAWSALFESPGRPKPGGTIVVLGTGGVSIVAAQLALASGLRVIATTSSDEKAKRLRALGVTDIVNYRTQPEWHEAVLERTGGEGADLVLEVGGAGTLERSLQAVRFGGTVSLIGFLGGAGARIDPLPVLFRASRLEGVIVGSVASARALYAALERLPIEPVVDEVFPMARANEALAKMASGTHFGKIVVTID